VHNEEELARERKKKAPARKRIVQARRSDEWIR